MNLDWLKEISEKIKTDEYQQKSYINIAGYPAWENVNSNFLSFYFDKEEEHGLNELFFKSLLEVYENKSNLNLQKKFSSSDDFTVEREIVIDDKKRIDILIKENSPDPNWAIIIENKIKHHLNNDLNKYWEQTFAKNKIGIVLSLDREDIKENKYNYVNITHAELNKAVEKNISAFKNNSTERHLIFLKDYLANVNSLKRDYKNMEEILKIFQENKDEIQKLKQAEESLLRNISEIVEEIMDVKGYKPTSKRSTSKYKHYYAKDDKNEFDKKFRFWFSMEHLKFHNSLWGFFELFGENTKDGADLINSLKFDNYVKKGTQKVDNQFFQIYELNIPLSENGENFKEKLKNSFEKYFFNPPNNYKDFAIENLKKQINQ